MPVLVGGAIGFSFAAMNADSPNPNTPKVSDNGFFVSEAGHILTNTRVIADCRGLTVFTTKQTTDALQGHCERREVRKSAKRRL
jgi:hypothetical protein